MPHEPRLPIARGLPNRFDRMNLVRPQQNDFFAFVIQDAVAPDHLVRERNVECGFGKGQVVVHRLIFFVHPPREELFVEVAAIVRSDVASLGAVRHHEHLHQPHQSPELAFFAVLFDLPVGIHVRMIGVLEFDVNHREPVDEKRHVKTTVALPRVSRRTVLVDDFINGIAACDFPTVDGHETHRPQLGIFTRQRNLRNAVFAREPPGCFVGGLRLVTNEVLHLRHFGVGQQHALQPVDVGGV